MRESPKISLYDLDLDQLKKLFLSWNEPAYRAEQVYRHLYRRGCRDLDSMTDLPTPLRARLRDETTLQTLDLVSVRTGDNGLTRKALFRRADGKPVESVLMIYPDRATVCVSTQSGCPIRCIFCATGQMGFRANLTSGQMIEQVLWAAEELARHAPGQKLTNVVYMGMGEPFLNYEAWRDSVIRLHNPKGLGLGARSFTVSTVGVIPGILRLSQMPLPVNLAVSLHAANDELRSRLIPLNRKYPLAQLREAILQYIAATNRRVSLEYVLLEDINDTLAHAQELADWCRGGPFQKTPRLLCHVNLIPWNPVPSLPLQAAQRQRVVAFQEVLRAAGIACTIRVQRGVKIGAACGQLAGQPNKKGAFT